MIRVLRSVIAPIVSLVILMIGSGLFMTIVPLRLKMEGASPFMIGAITAAYYAGLFFGCFHVEKFILRIGHIRAYASLAAITAALTMIMAFFVNEVLWLSMRFLGGVCLAGLYISIESWLLVKSSERTRGKVLAVYMISLYGANAGGQFLLDLGSPGSLIPFALVVFFCCLSIVPITLTQGEEPTLESHSLLKFRQLIKISPVGFMGSFLSGMLLSALYGLAPIYAQEIGMQFPEIATFMGATLFGGLLLQWPLGFLSDRKDRRVVISWSSFLAAIIALGIALTGLHFPLILLVLSCLFAAFSFPLYPLSISHCCDHIESKDIVAATGGLLLAYGLGAILGPLLAPVFMSFLGPNGLYYYFILFCSALGTISLIRIKQKDPIPEEEKFPFTNIPRTTPVIGELDPRQESESNKKDTP